MLKLLLDGQRELAVELLDQLLVRLRIDVVGHSLVGYFLCVFVGLERFDLVLALLVDGLLVKHHESRLSVSRAHNSRLFIDLRLEELLAV